MFLEVFLGFILGCLSSIIVSIFWYKILVPKIIFADSICKCRLENNQGYEYKIKFRNNGLRDIFEMHLYCILSIPDLVIEGSTHTVDINLSYNFKPYFRRRGKNGKLGLDGVVRLCMNDIQMLEECTRSIYPNDIIEKAKNRQLSLDDLIKIKGSSYINFYIIAHDKFTGSKKLFKSKDYTIEDIKHGLYKSGELYVVQF